MNTKINSVNFSASFKLEQFIQDKVSKLSQYYESIIGAEVFLKAEKNTINENKIVKIKIEIPGNDLFAEKQAKTFEEATDMTVEALRRQITKHKEKQRGV